MQVHSQNSLLTLEQAVLTRKHTYFLAAGHSMYLASAHLAALGPQVGQSPPVNLVCNLSSPCPGAHRLFRQQQTIQREQDTKPACCSSKTHMAIGHTAGRLRSGTYRPGLKGLHRHPLATLCRCRAPGCSQSVKLPASDTTPEPQHCCQALPNRGTSGEQRRQSGDVRQAKQCLTHAAQLLRDNAPDSSQASCAVRPCRRPSFCDMHRTLRLLHTCSGELQPYSCASLRQTCRLSLDASAPAGRRQQAPWHASPLCAWLPGRGPPAPTCPASAPAQVACSQGQRPLHQHHV